MNKVPKITVGSIARFALCAGISLTALAVADPAFAGEATAASSDAVGIADIVVTAQRREEKLQNVPIAIAAINADAMTNLGISDTRELQIAVPGLQISRAQFSVKPRIRGIGSTSVGPGLENSVAVYVDDVYIASGAASLLSFNNIERVEVLKGPQGTLFGRNATGGLIQVITKQPSLSGIEGEIKAHYGKYDSFGGDVYISGPLSSNVAVSFAAQGSRQGKGFGTNLFTGDSFGKTYKDISIRGKLLWQIDDATTFNFSADHFERKYQLVYIADPNFTTPPAVLGALAKAKAANPLLNTTIPRGGYDVNINHDDYIDQDGYGLSGKLEHDFGGFTVKSITAWRQDRYPSQTDLDQSPVTVLHLANPDARTGSNLGTSQFTQELQILSPSTSKLNWILGAYYFRSRYYTLPASTVLGYPATIPGASGFGAVATSRSIVAHTKSYAFFGQATYPITDNTHFTAGLRYTNEDRDFAGTSTNFLSTDPTGGGANPFPSTTSFDKSTSFDAMTWRLSLDHRFNDELMVYASYNRGFKSGGFDISSPANAAFRPEKVDAYEIGIKSDLLDHRVRMNLAGFYSNYRDIQVSRATGAQVATENAARARVYGIEGELTAVVIKGLTLSANFTYLDHKFTDYNTSICTQADPTLAGYLTQKACTAYTPAKPTATGNRLPETPDFTAGIGGTYEASLPGNAGSVMLAARLYHSSSWFNQPENLQAQKGYEVLNGSMTWRSAGDRYSIRVYGENLTNAYYYTQMTLVPSFAAYGWPAPPRTFGVEVGVKF